MAQGTHRGPSLLSKDPPADWAVAAQHEDRSGARDLNLDQTVAAIAGDREERDLITTALFSRLRDADAVRYRQEVFQDLEDPALSDAVRRFSHLICEVRAHLRQLGTISCTDLRDACLALQSPDPVVGNDVQAGGKELVIITDAAPDFTWEHSLGLPCGCRQCCHCR